MQTWQLRHHHGADSYTITGPNDHSLTIEADADGRFQIANYPDHIPIGAFARLISHDDQSS